MTIHHATKTKAEKQGVILAHDETGDVVIANNPQYSRYAEHEDAKTALALCVLSARFAANGYKLDVSAHPDLADEPDNWAVHFEDVILVAFDPVALAQGGQKMEDSLFADALEAATEEELDFEEEEDDRSGSIVHPKYKQRYAEAGDATCCGDWFALWLKEEYTIKIDGKGRPMFDREGFTQLLAENGVDLTQPWATTTKGNNGTYKMSGRLAMEHDIVTRLGGTFKQDGKDMGKLVPAEWKQQAKDWAEAQKTKAENKAKQKKIAA